MPLINMAANENPFGPSPKAIEAIRTASALAHLYPDNSYATLRARLAELHSVQPDQLLVTAGTTTFLDLLARALLGPRLNAITSKTSFVVYPEVTRAAGGQIIEVPTRDDSYDLDGILAAVNDNTRVVFIANPNNPTGTMLDAAAIDKFLEQLPSHVLTVIDEAYFDYAQFFAAQQGVEYSRSLDYVRQNRPVIVLRTFSKAHGLAGLRVGYAVGPAELLSYLHRLKPAFQVSAVAEIAALAALDDLGHIQHAIEANAAGQTMLRTALSAMGIPATPSSANFLFCRVGESAPAVCEALHEHGIRVKALTHAWRTPDAFRVTVGTPEQNERFLEAMRRVWKQEK